MDEGLGEENAWLRSTHEVVAVAVVAELGEEHANSKILGFMVFEISFALSCGTMDGDLFLGSGLVADL